MLAYQKALVTGRCGFIGAHLVAELLSMGKDVRVFDNLSTGSEERLVPGPEVVRGDLRNAEEVAAAV